MGQTHRPPAPLHRGMLGLTTSLSPADVDYRTIGPALVKNLHAAYNETQTALAHLDSLYSAADLAAESLRLNTSRYQTDKATMLGL